LAAKDARRSAARGGSDFVKVDGDTAQREESLQDPGQNIFIASEYLAQLKSESEFADVRAEEMTPAQYQELAARYNGGPYWQSDDAQVYGRGFRRHLIWWVR
jgi:soluble lytic murein transglycosylase-like protein